MKRRKKKQRKSSLVQCCSPTSALNCAFNCAIALNLLGASFNGSEVCTEGSCRLVEGQFSVAGSSGRGMKNSLGAAISCSRAVQLFLNCFL